MPDESTWNRQRFEAWERSPEGVSYRLDLGPFVEDPAREQRIVETVMRLPEDVREYVYEHCMFLWGDDFGRTWPGDLFAGKWIIVLHPDLPAEEVHGVIAHEIAHAYLQHHVAEAPPTCEVEAAELTKSWGFSGKGADVEWHRHWSLGKPKPAIGEDLT
jgi:hypothetical protein